MKKIALSICMLSLLLPIFAFAQTPPAQVPVDRANTPQVPVDKAAPTVSTQAKLQNPLKGVGSISELFYKIVDFVISLSYVVIAAFLIWSGFKFVAAQGSDEKIADAKRTFFYTIIGALLIVGAQTIIAILRNIFSGLNS